MKALAQTLFLALGCLLATAPALAQVRNASEISRSDDIRNLAEYAFPHLAPGEPVKCGLGIIAHALHNRSILGPTLQGALSRVMLRTERQKTLIVGRFKVHYDTAGTHAAAMLDDTHQRVQGSADIYADSVAVIANQVYALEVPWLGYQAPPSDGNAGGGQEYDIYIEEMGNQYGETMPESPLDNKPDGGRFTTYMRIDNDFVFVNPAANKGLPGLRVTLAHEFQHAIQLGCYGYWTGDSFFYEICSTWMEDVVFPGINDYLNYFRASWGHFRNPAEAFSSNGLISYSRAIWGHFVARKFGRDIMREVWEAVRDQGHRPLAAMDLALSRPPYNSSFRFAFSDWVLWNYYTGARANSTLYYPQGALYPDVAQSPTDFTPPSGTLSGELPPLAARYHQVHTSADTVTLIQANIDLLSAEQGSSTLFPYTIHLNASLVDESYDQAGSVLFFKPSVAVPANWKSLNIVRGIPSTTGLAEGVPFPNPFRPDLTSFIRIPAKAPYGTLYIYSSSMELVFSAATTPTFPVAAGPPMFSWDGYTKDHGPARTGIYIFVLSLPDRTLTGKIALIRN